MTIAKEHLCCMGFIRRWMPVLTFLLHEVENQLHVQILSLSAVHALWLSSYFLFSDPLQQNGIWAWFEHFLSAQSQIKQLYKCEDFPDHLVLNVCYNKSCTEFSILEQNSCQINIPFSFPKHMSNMSRGHWSPVSEKICIT